MKYLLSINYIIILCFQLKNPTTSSEMSLEQQRISLVKRLQMQMRSCRISWNLFVHWCEYCDPSSECPSVIIWRVTQHGGSTWKLCNKWNIDSLGAVVLYQKLIFNLDLMKCQHITCLFCTEYNNESSAPPTPTAPPPPKKKETQ